MSEAIQKYISRLRSELERQYQEDLAAINLIEKAALNNGALQIPVANHAAIPAVSPAVSPNGISQVDRVLAALKTAPKTIEQLIKDIPEMDFLKIRAVLYSSKRIQPLLKKDRTASGVVFSLRENAPAEKRHLNKNSAASMVRALVEKTTSGLLAAEIADALRERIKNPTTIYSALHKLKTSGRLKYDSESKKYLPLAPN